MCILYYFLNERGISDESDLDKFEDAESNESYVTSIEWKILYDLRLNIIQGLERDYWALKGTPLRSETLKDISNYYKLVDQVREHLDGEIGNESSSELWLT